MIVLPKLTLFVTSPTLMIPSSVQEVILFAVCAILCGHMARIALFSAKSVARTVLFSAKTVSGYLAEVRVLSYNCLHSHTYTHMHCNPGLHGV